MKIFLTGATGFLGSRVALKLLDRGDEVISIRRPSSCLKRLGNDVDKIKWVEHVEDGFTDKIDAVIHTATDYGKWGQPAHELIKSNVELAIQLYELCPADAMFVNIDTVLPPEVSPYALSKHQAGEWLARMEHGTALVTLRMQTMYGPTDSRFVGTLIRDCLNNKPVIPLTPGAQLRDFIHVDDAASAILRVINHSFPSGSYDVGTGYPISLRLMVELIVKLTDSNSIPDFGGLSYRKHEPMMCSADTTKMEKLGWVASIPLMHGLTATIDQMRQ